MLFHVKLEMNQFLHIHLKISVKWTLKIKTLKVGWLQTTDLQLSLSHLQRQVCDASSSDAGSRGGVKLVPDCIDIGLSETTAATTVKWRLKK